MNAAAWRSLVLTLVIAAAAGFVGARFGMPGPRPPGLTYRQDSVRQSVDSLLQRDYKLTPAQQQQVQSIDEKFTRTHNLIWADIRIYNGKLGSAVATDMALTPDAKAAIDGIASSVGRLHTESILYVLEVRKVLTPPQRNHYDEQIILALMRDPA